ncbi:hypothetical protein TNCV_5112071 [Trichonephila clavipes]|nr:hypothetical protein TNCV_5112071 [Trichonephila clavipes]
MHAHMLQRLFETSVQPNTCNFFPWPAYSPDMSLIQQVGNMVGRRLTRDPSPAASKDEVLPRIQLNAEELWDIESIGIRSSVVENGKSGIQHSDMIERYQKNIEIFPNGKYEVELSFKIEGQFTDNRGLTLKKLK